MKGKCNEHFEETWVNGVTYNGIDAHHNPPEFLMDIWEGEMINLCRECHRKIHDKIIILMNKKAETLKFNKSEHWLKQKMCNNQIDELVKEVYNFTKKWVENN